MHPPNVSKWNCALPGGDGELRLPIILVPVLPQKHNLVILPGQLAQQSRCLFDYHGQAMKRRRSRNALKVFTIGHSTHSIEHFIELLESNGVKQLIDIRSIPKSRHNPQFYWEALARSLGAAQIRYIHLEELGGLRRASPHSVNLGWRNASFRGYADYMQTREFQSALARAIELAQERTTALMCAEAVPWRCHRSLVADALTIRGIEVLDIVSSSAPQAHVLTPFAQVRGTRITYPAAPAFQ